ncbi:MAG: hypothetical protein HOV79_08900 [Hamadaea sp.]|nr:hypothetical protein [Hamadaea sp.]
MSTLADAVHAELDATLAGVDERLRRQAVASADGRQPVHTVYVPADRIHADLVDRWRTDALAAVRAHGPLPCAAELTGLVEAKLAREPIEDLRIDFEDGYGVRPDADEDAAVDRVATFLAEAALPPFVGVRCKSLEEGTRRRAVRTLDRLFGRVGPRPLTVTLPKVSDPAQVRAMVLLCQALEEAHGLGAGALRFEIQIETPAAVLDTDGRATVPLLIAAAEGRCVGLHYGTYDYSAALGIAAHRQSLAHPAADHAKAVMQLAVAGTGVRLSDGSSNVLPVGATGRVRAAWRLHHRLVRRSLDRGFYQGWDLHPAQLPTRYAATYAFFRDGAPAAADRLRAYLDRRAERTGVLDEPATARALAGYLLRGLDCGALTESDAGFPRTELEAL